MNQKKSDKKSGTLTRDSSRDNTEKVKNPKLERAQLNLKRGVKNGNHLSDAGYAGISRESPRKSRSVERKSLNKNSVNTTPSHKNTTKTPAVVNKKSSINTKNPVNRRENSIDKSPASYKTSQVNSKSNKPLQKAKANERKTNAQIAKSFVQSVAPKKPARLKSNIPKAAKHHNITESAEAVHLERPRTSTIRKEPSIPIDDSDHEEKEEKLKKRSLSRSKTSLKDSDDEKASYEDDFEDYNSDFEDSESESISDTDTSSESSDHSEDLVDSEIENNVLSTVHTLPPKTNELPPNNQSNTELSANKSGEKNVSKNE